MSVFLAQNLKFLRERKKISQEVLAKQLGMTRSKLNAIENGQTKAPQPEDLLLFSSYYKMSIDTLFRVDLATIGGFKLHELELGNDVYVSGGRIRVLSITVDGQNKENMEYVPVKAKAGYMSGYADPNYIAALPKFSLPSLPQNGSYRMFPTKGDSMLPIPEGSDVVGKYLQDWTVLRKPKLCILILKGNQDFVFKEATLLESGMLQLRSLNTSYQPYEVAVEDVLEIWQFVQFHSKILPEPLTDLQEVKRMIVSIVNEKSL